MSADDKVSLRAWVAVTGGLFGCFMAGMNVHVTSAALPEIEGALEPPSRRARGSPPPIWSRKSV